MKQQKEEEKEQILLSGEQAEILEALSPRIVNESGENKLLINIDNFKKSVDSIRERGSSIILESDLLGLRCRLDSRNKDIEQLQSMAHDSMRFLLKEIPSHSIVKFPTIPRGVG